MEKKPVLLQDLGEIAADIFDIVDDLKAQAINNNLTRWDVYREMIKLQTLFWVISKGKTRPRSTSYAKAKALVNKIVDRYQTEESCHTKI